MFSQIILHPLWVPLIEHHQAFVFPACSFITDIFNCPLSPLQQAKWGLIGVKVHSESLKGGRRLGCSGVLKDVVKHTAGKGGARQRSVQRAG